jgi:hypothetical protein
MPPDQDARGFYDNSNIYRYLPRYSPPSDHIDGDDDTGGGGVALHEPGTRRVLVNDNWVTMS